MSDRGGEDEPRGELSGRGAPTGATVFQRQGRVQLRLGNSQTEEQLWPRDGPAEERLRRGRSAPCGWKRVSIPWTLVYGHTVSVGYIATGKTNRSSSAGQGGFEGLVIVIYDLV
jgi:hypothetical protein